MMRSTELQPYDGNGEPDRVSVPVPVKPAPTAREAATSPPARRPPVRPAPGARPSAGTLPDPGDLVGQYELIRELGRGGMGAVFLARDTRLGRLVAVKFLQSNQPELTSRFILEARATAQCSHENIVIIHEVGEHQGNPFMVLEYMEGSPLNKLLDDGRTLPVARAVDIITRVVSALVKAHQHNIVHRDLKPDNIFITESGTVKVLDFGIAKLIQEQAPAIADPRRRVAAIAASISDSELGDSGVATGEAAHQTRQGAIVGTLPYMSPEQWGIDTVDHRTDIWAVGILLYRMIVGAHPLGQMTKDRLVLTAMIEQPMPSARGADPNMPDDLAAVIDRCLIKPKDQRIGSAAELLRALEPFLPGHHRRLLSQDQSPYTGLSAFQEADAQRFFGRAGEIAAAVTRLREQPLVAVVGPSGAGKSSFVRAGVVPELKRSGESWLPLIIRPGRHPLAALAEMISPMASQASQASGTQSTGISEIEAELHRMGEQLRHAPGLLGTVLRNQAHSKQQKILIFVDQFEELYTLVADESERRAFTACLGSVADDPTSPLRVVISIRSDFLERVPEDPHFMANLTRGLFFLLPPGGEGLRDALTQPAEMAGYQFESQAIVDNMLAHLEQTPGALPLLQFTATRLWDTRDRERRLLTDASYRQIGGVTGALASHADSVVGELPPQGQLLARALFLRLITPDRTRAVVAIDELHELSQVAGAVQSSIDHLVSARLLVVQTAPTGASVEIVHESLIHTWPRLRRWLDENHDDAAYLDQLRTAARQWQAKACPTGLLWRGEAADEARRWHRRYRGDLTRLEDAYLRAVFALAARAQRTKRIVLAASFVFLFLLIAAAAVALVVIHDAQKDSERQALAARAAEQEVHQQLGIVEQQKQSLQQETRDKEQALSESKAALRDKEDAQRALDRNNRELQSAYDRAEKERRRAIKAKRRAVKQAREAERSRRQAEAASRAALKAKEDEKNAKEESLLREQKCRGDKASKGSGFDVGPDVTPVKPKELAPRR